MQPILEFVPRCSRHSKLMGQGPQCFSKCLEEVEVAIASKPATEPAVNVEPAAVKVRKVAVSNTEPAPTHLRESRVSHATKKDPTAAVRRARWRKKNPEQHADQQRAARARQKEKV
jgi:hypothetical protein